MGKIKLFTLKKNINKVLILTVFGMAFINLLDCKIVFGEDKPKLRWEYKYQEGETLMYIMKGEDGTNENNVKNVEAVLGIAIKEEIKDGIKKAATWTMKIEEGYEYLGYVARNPYQESIRGYIEINRDGNIEGIWYGSIFHLGLPRFLESGLDMWSRDIEVNENIGNTVGARIKFKGHYRKLMQEEIVKGRRCILFETEIGRFGDTGGEFKSIAGKARLELYAKTWFSPEEGRVIKIDSDLKVFSYHRDDLRTFPTYRRYKERAINNNNEKYKTKEEKKKALEEVDKQLEEMKKSGKTELEFYWDEPSVRRHFTYELLDEKEIKKLDGIEDDWELVLPGINNFQLTVDGKIVFTKEEAMKEKFMDSTGSEQEKEVKKGFIWISEGDGSGQRKLTEGVNPVVSQDGKMIAFSRIRKDERYGEMEEIWIISSNGFDEKILAKDENISYWKDNWSPNGEYILLRITEHLFNDLKIKKHDKTGIAFQTGEKIIINENEQPYGWTSWSSNNDLISFAKYEAKLGQRINLKYDLKNKKLYEFEELNQKKVLESGVWSPTQLIYTYKGDYNKGSGIPLGLLYFSDKYEMVKEKILLGNYKDEYADSYYWMQDGENLIYRTNKNLTYVYNVKEEKNIWANKYPQVSGFIKSISSDYKWNYFNHIGTLTRFLGLYRITTPKEFQKALTVGGK